MNVSVTVLVVEDNLMIHDVIVEALIDGGFAVAKATTPEEAEGIIDSTDVPYRAIVTDINLAPGKPTGWDVARRAREINADLPIVYMTGDSGDQWASCGVPNSIASSLRSHSPPSQITTAVAHLLNEGRASN
jgi:CheY-like chemotaxis protein